jgi:hypothetical protein
VNLNLNVKTGEEIKSLQAFLIARKLKETRNNCKDNGEFFFFSNVRTPKETSIVISRLRSA